MGLGHGGRESAILDLSDLVRFRAIMVQISNIGLFDAPSTMNHVICLLEQWSLESAG